MNISQSIIKDYEAYQDGGLCGIVFKARYIDKTFPDMTSQAMNLGCYFEYLTTGALPKSGKVPVPSYTKTEMKKDPEQRKPEGMLAPYKLALINSERVKGYLSKIGLIIEGTGVYKAENGLEGTCDIIGDLGGNKVIIDLKYSGLLNDKYMEYGWGALELDNYYGAQQRRHHSTQAIHYSKLFGADEFYYLVCSSSNETDIGFFKINFTEEAERAHEYRIEQARQGIELGKTVGFKAHPDVIRCAHCAWKTTCKKAIFYPEPKQIEITGETIWKS